MGSFEASESFKAEEDLFITMFELINLSQKIHEDSSRASNISKEELAIGRNNRHQDIISLLKKHNISESQFTNWLIFYSADLDMEDGYYFEA